MRGFSQFCWLGFTLARRDIEQRYRGTALGFAWPFANAALLLGVFSLVFSVILRVRWGGALGNSALMIFAGLVPFLFIAEVLTRSSLCVIAVPNFVKKVRFPLALLPIVLVASALVIAAINTLILCIAALATLHSLPWQALLLPLVFVPMVLFAVGLAMFLGSLGVFFRDLAQVMPLFAQVLMYLAPVCYPRTIVPARFGRYIDLNPLTWFVETIRALLFGGDIPPLWQWIAQTVVWLCFAGLGYSFFHRTRRMFADLL
ncbi:ABC transporter permease [Pararobbsia alpina]|uniref:Transport permease protein n=1 Tax=Pararobbsia alpina TaxID=621374 RepID=A0A6S7BKZ5_9BURK|nr:ABC transporter permease [Pararobbsia alpina]CAB3804058.1 Teichoic acid translocation permease protein TagG [Pararobbsia alpina]